MTERTPPPAPGANKRRRYGSLATACPALAAQWHPAKNGALTPADVTLGSGKKAWWLCERGHEWQAVVGSRTKGAGCPSCASARQTSFPEQAVFYYLRQAMRAENRARVNGAEVDVWLPELGIAIEYDGMYYHGRHARQRETAKEQALLAHGAKLVRIREGQEQPPPPSGGPVYCIGCRYEASYAFLEPVLRELFALLSKLSGRELLPAGPVDVQTDRPRILQQYLTAQRQNSLQSLVPDAARLWNARRNGALTPDLFSISSNQKVWWQCVRGHEWSATIQHVSQGSRCPYCDGKRVWPGFNDLASLCPALTAQWDPVKNGGATPERTLANAQKKCWWLCPQGHTWQASPYIRRKGGCCPVCSRRKITTENCLAVTNPALAAQWHPAKNGALTPWQVVDNTNKKAWWLCEKGHEWQALIYSRTAGCGCPYCANRRVDAANSLAAVDPALARQWHPLKNDSLLPSQVVANSHRAVWWQCGKGHEWRAGILQRHCRGTGCPYCSGQKVIAGKNDLLGRNPALAAQWHPTRNGALTPASVMASTHRKVWWLCERGHEWEAAVSNRSNGNGCIYCAGQKVLPGENDLAALWPALAAQWHPTKNGGLLASQVFPGTHRVAWWQCGCGHIWQTAVQNRTRKGRVSCCPRCKRPPAQP